MKNLTKDHLEKIGTQDLFTALNYSEGLATACQSMYSIVEEAIQKKEISQNDIEYELKNLNEIYQEHNSLSFIIEKELGRRFKRKFSLKSTTETLSKVRDSIQKKIENKKKPALKMS